MQDISGMHLESQMPEGNNNNGGDKEKFQRNCQVPVCQTIAIS